MLIPHYFLGFVFKFAPDGLTLEYGTYLGGSGYDLLVEIAIDALGAAYVTGSTASVNFPVVNPHPDGAAVHGGDDAFVAKIVPDGSALAYCSYLGGSAYEIGIGIAVDAAGSAYVTGSTSSGDFAVVSPTDCGLNGAADAFVTQFTPAGNALAFSTYLGGAGNDYGNTIGLDASGIPHVVGYATASFPTSPGAFDASFNGGDLDVFVTRLICGCPCWADPGGQPGACDGVNSDIIDVVQTVNVAFRGQSATKDIMCGSERTDVDASCVTDVIDVVKVVNVAFRGFAAFPPTVGSQYAAPSCP